MNELKKSIHDNANEMCIRDSRQYAAKLAGLDTLPVIVRQMSDDAAVILMVDSNLQDVYKRQVLVLR